MTVAILLLAAGASRRFGTENKLLAPLAGKPLVRHAGDAARAVPAALHFVVTSTPRWRRCSRISAGCGWNRACRSRTA